jgi:hypothetical protein
MRLLAAPCVLLTVAGRVDPGFSADPPWENCQ